MEICAASLEGLFDVSECVNRRCLECDGDGLTFADFKVEKGPFGILNDRKRFRLKTVLLYCIAVPEAKTMRTVLSVSLPEKMAKELDALAKATGRNKSDIVKESLGAFLWETKFRQAQARLRARAKAAGVITEDDVFKAVS